MCCRSLPSALIRGTEKIAGDVAISVETAIRQCVEQGHSLATEIKVLMLHGLLHLAGYDHETDAGEMQRRERSLRARLGLPLGLIERTGSKPASQPVGRAGAETEAMTPLQILCVAVLAVVQTLASYISRVYSEFGKILSREVQENLDAWETRIEPHLGLSREHAALCAAVLLQLSLGLIALEFGAIFFAHARFPARRTRRRLRRRF